MPAARVPAMGFQIFFTPDLGMFVYGLEEFADQFKSLKEPLKRSIQQVMAPSFQKNFDVGGRPSWAELSEATLARKTGTDILVKTGLLRRVAGQLNLWEIDGIEGMAYVKEDMPRAQYGAFHQEGTDDLPARPWAVFQEEDEADVYDIFGDWMEEKWRRPGM